MARDKTEFQILFRRRGRLPWALRWRGILVARFVTFEDADLFRDAPLRRTCLPARLVADGTGRESAPPELPHKGSSGKRPPPPPPLQREPRQ